MKNLTVMNTKIWRNRQASPMMKAYLQKMTVVDVLPSPPPPFPFIAADGIDYAYDGDASELDFYESFIDNELVDLIVTETNRYTQQ